jgi:hypothetical protein
MRYRLYNSILLRDVEQGEEICINRYHLEIHKILKTSNTAGV